MKKILSAVLACTATMALAATAFATDAGGTDAGATQAPKTETFEVTVSVPADGKLSGAALDAVLLVDKETEKTYTWADVEEVVFSSDDMFSVSFAANKDKAGVEVFVMGVNELPGDDEGPAKPAIDAPEALRDENDGRYALTWALTSDYIALFADTADVTVQSESGEAIEIKSEVTVKVAAEEPGKEPGNDPNPPTGIALAVAPAGLAVAFVTVAAVMSKKKRG